MLFALGAGCGGESTDSSPTWCIGDEDSPGGCSKTWQVLEGCPATLSTGDVVELAVFEGGCPDDATLLGGDTATAVLRLTVPFGEPLPKVSGLEKKLYGFAALGRSGSCIVKAFGCTTAHLAEIQGIRTAICDWGDPTGGGCLCVPPAGGGCPPSETCSAGRCSGATAE